MKCTKVIIKSKADNPKEPGRYLTEFGWLSYNGKWIYPQNKGTIYLRGICWYLIEDTEPSYPEPFVKWCLENVSIDEKHGSEVYVLYTFGDRLMFPNMEKLHEYWLNKIKNKGSNC